MHMSGMKGSQSMKTESVCFGDKTENIFHVDFLENKIVAFNKNTTAGQWQDQNQSYSNKMAISYRVWNCLTCS